MSFNLRHTEGWNHRVALQTAVLPPVVPIYYLCHTRTGHNISKNLPTSMQLETLDHWATLLLWETEPDIAMATRNLITSHWEVNLTIHSGAVYANYETVEFNSASLDLLSYLSKSLKLSSVKKEKIKKIKCLFYKCMLQKSSWVRRKCPLVRTINCGLEPKEALGCSIW